MSYKFKNSYCKNKEANKERKVGRQKRRKVRIAKINEGGKRKKERREYCIVRILTIPSCNIESVLFVNISLA